MSNNLTEKSRILDIGCGTGGQTMVIGKNTPCEIIGVDIWPDFIEKFNQNVADCSFQGRVKGIVGDMANLPFQNEEFDLIWSEGSIYNIGFEHGLNEWRKFLKQDGYIAVMENTWFTEFRPAEIDDFWQKNYPGMDTVANKVAQMQRAGYLLVAAFILPETIWIDYYTQQASRLSLFLEKYKGNKVVEEFITSQQFEAEMYLKYKSYYGYMFYIGKKLAIDFI